MNDLAHWKSIYYYFYPLQEIRVSKLPQLQIINKKTNKTFLKSAQGNERKTNETVSVFFLSIMFSLFLSFFFQTHTPDNFIE